MSYAPSSYQQARSVLVARGIPAASIGIVGNPLTHRRGYHLGRDRIYGPGGQGSADYSVRTPRDRAGLTNAAAALDVGGIPRDELAAMAAWIVAQCRAGRADAAWVREVIYPRELPGGWAVFTWDRERGQASAPRLGGDDTHLSHFHLSGYRDAETDPKAQLFTRYYVQEVDVRESYIEPWMPAPVTVDQGTTYTDAAGEPVGTVDDGRRPYWAVETSPDGTRTAIAGNPRSARALIRWVPTSAVNRS